MFRLTANKRIQIMETVLKNEKNSTSRQIEKVVLTKRQRDRALADLEKANIVVGAFFAASRLIHRR
jgi:hypothetical protein